MSVLDHAVDIPLTREGHASRHLAGGIVNHGYQCGMIWGGALFAGAQAYQLLGPRPQAETKAIMASKRVVESFHGFTKNRINCHDKSPDRRRYLLNHLLANL